MSQDQFEFPHVISIEQLKDNGRSNLATNKKLVEKILSEAYRGVVTKEGEWAKDTRNNVLSPGPWQAEKQETGKYKIVHSLGHKNTSLSVSLLQSPGSFKIMEHHPMYFTLETYLDSKLTDMPFMFTLIRVISP